MKISLFANLVTPFRGVLAAGLLCLLASPVGAAPVFYTDRTAFNLATGGGLGFESFEVAPGIAAPSFTFPGFTISETGGINLLGNKIDFPGVVDAAVTDGLGALLYDDNGSSIGNFFNFTGPVNAFGLDLTLSSNGTVTIGGSVNTVLNRTANTPAFFGIIDIMAPITSITFNVSGGPDVGFDAVSYGQVGANPVPEPSTMILLGTGLAGIIAWRRKTAA